jgi:hypothetical protein
MPYNKLFINLVCSRSVQRNIGPQSFCTNLTLWARSVQRRPRSHIFSVQSYYYVSDLIDRHIDFDQWEFCVVWVTHFISSCVVCSPSFPAMRDCSWSTGQTADNILIYIPFQHTSINRFVFL